MVIPSGLEISGADRRVACRCEACEVCGKIGLLNLSALANTYSSGLQNRLPTHRQRGGSGTLIRKLTVDSQMFGKYFILLDSV